MWGRIRRLREEIADLRAQLDRMRERAETAESNEKTERHNRRLITRQFCEADATNIRLEGRVRRLTDQLERAHEAAQDGALDEMGGRLDRALRACARYRADADGQARLIRSQQELLDRLYGLDTPAVAEGERWQERRHDRMKGVRL
ncbi:hypothetical protein [Streptomyces cucumeris]|uniref:hypothetical protein n=1 Tax=Streptomyces cucumeris TaxID=2962890 RepID=UPI0020C85A3F|nr:hypothetical protein [Streptomyces sp. NEAU-Y11]MCP9205548.1 hypothetical protein [Streptomyces sp. NEAU-Y11]